MEPDHALGRAAAAAGRRAGQTQHRPPARREAPPPSARAAAVRTPAPPPRPAPELEPLDRKLKRRLARGTVEIDARLDLHGKTQSQAHAALLRFLHKAQGNGARVVLVITGKGARARRLEASAACSSAKCRYGSGCRNSAAMSSASSTRMSATAGRARSTCGSGVSGRAAGSQRAAGYRVTTTVVPKPTRL